MENDSAIVQPEWKKLYFSKFVLLGKTALVYIDDRKVIKFLIKQLNREKKNLDKTRYPLSDAERRDIAIAITELVDKFESFLHPDELEHFYIAVQALKNYIPKLEYEIEPPTGSSAAKKAIDAAMDTAKNLSEKIGKGVAELKKTVQEISSK